MRILFFILLLAMANLALAQQNSPSNNEKKVLKEQQSPIKRSSKTTVQNQTATPSVSNEDNISTKTPKLANVEKGSNNNAAAYQYLGLDPNTATAEQYNAAKTKLHNEQPEKYEELKRILQGNGNDSNQTKKHTIKRSDFNAMSPERKALIDANPTRYQIID